MIKFTKPKNLNGQELLAELESNGIEVIGYPVVDDNNVLWLDINVADETNAEMVVKNHNGNIVPIEPTIEDKLASVGLNLSDLKRALGL